MRKERERELANSGRQAALTPINYGYGGRREGKAKRKDMRARTANLGHRDRARMNASAAASFAFFSLFLVLELRT